MILTDTPETAFDKIAMDIVGPLPITENGNQYILTIQDLLTKFSLAIPLRRATAIDTADALVKRMFCIFGTPRAVLTDQGTNFLSSLMKQLAKIYKIKQIKTTAFHPQSNGSLERSHHLLIEYLKQYVSEDKEWDEWLELATYSYNTSVHEGTQHTPYELVFGKIARQPSNEPYPEETNSKSYNDYITNLLQRIYNAQTAARQNLIQAKLKSKQYYDRKMNTQQFDIGNYVFLQQGMKQGKFGDHYTGPYKVLEIFDNGNIKIKIGRATRIVHPNRLRYSHIQPSEGDTSDSD
jgi:Integrase core domain.